MPRPKTFDENAVLTQSMSVFWKRGFERTSMKEIEQATKLSAGSVYHEFGGKKQLFERSLKHYIEKIIGFRIAHYLVDQASPIEGIREFLKSSVQEVPKEFIGQSCLLVNSAAELGQEDVEIGKVIRYGFKKLELAMSEAFSKAQTKGEIRPEIDPAAAAQQVCMLMPGMLISAKNGNQAEMLNRIVDFNLKQFTSHGSIE